jgi:flagellin-like protein
MKRVNKKGLSPVIATVLLIAMVVVIGMIVFLWIRGLSPEVNMKLGKNIALTCDDVKFDASLSGDSVSISNKGNVPIDSMQVQMFDSEGEYKSKELAVGLEVGDAGDFDLNGNPDRIILIPILLGETDDGPKTYTCENNGHEFNQ